MTDKLPVKIPGTEAASSLTQKFLTLLEDGYTQQNEAEFPLLKFPSEFAEKMHVHTNHLNATVKTASGKTVSEHIHTRLLTEAQLLLWHTGLTIAEISLKLGFKETTHFCSYFKRNLNTTPIQYKRSINR